MRLSLLSLALMIPAPALAGGVGIIGTGGAHSDHLYYYSSEVQTIETDAGTEEQTIYTQEPMYSQVNPNFGGGLELILGDRDDKILGMFRVYYLQDTAQRAAGLLAEPNDYTYNLRSIPRDLGVITGGLQWGLVGDPKGLQLNLLTNLGAGFFTDDFTEFVLAEVGVGGSYMVNRHLQLHADLSGGLRFRKGFYHTENFYLGARWLFD